MKIGILLASIFTAGALWSSPALAQKIMVKKVKGKQAVIEFSGRALKAGQSYEVSQDVFEDPSLDAGERNYLVSVSFSLLNTKSDAANSENDTDIFFSGRLGWNLGNFEWGPLVSLTSDTNGATTSTIYQLGGFADYNMITNSPGEIFIYGLGGTGSWGQRQTSGASALDLLEMFMGPYVKWFPTGNSVGFRFDLGYIYIRQSGGIGSEITTTGLATTAGITAYF